jgi:chromosome segregation ATPase
MGCHSGPVFAGDTAYRAIEREADRAGTELAMTGAEIVTLAGNISDRADRIDAGLANLGQAIEAGDDKAALLDKVAATDGEVLKLTEEAAVLQETAARLDAQLAEQRLLSAALSAEHDRREHEAAGIAGELAGARLQEEMWRRKAAVRLAVIVALAAAIAGYIAFQVLRFLRIIPV